MQPKMGSTIPEDMANEYEFPRNAEDFAPAPTPSLDEWRQLWKVWDLATREMIPARNLHDKPVSLRNDLIFYLGHIPTFEDIHLTRALRAEPTPPRYYQQIFERGIDPDVDDPTKCHDHSEVPSEWPTLDEILGFQDKVRQRIASLYKTGRANERIVQRALWIGFEHEALHLETFLYMTIQSDAIQPPLSVPPPDFRSLAISAQSRRVKNEWVEIPARTVNLGINPTDLEDETIGPARYYGWDNERPLRSIEVPKFHAKAQPMTNGEYASYMLHENVSIPPAAWKVVDPIAIDDSIQVESPTYATFVQDKAVRTVFGPVPLQYALDWPIMASYNELQSCATWLGGTIPTLEQARSIHTQVELRQRKPHLEASSNNGVPSSTPNPLDIFVDMTDYNVGFANFHPTPVTHVGHELCSGLGGLGGAWELTSTVTEVYDGFKPMDIYPGYTLDFLDGKHYYAIGGSWATHPRIAGRKSFLSWWQPSYVYAWTTARIVRPCS